MAALHRSRAEETLLVGDSLRVTGVHPVFVNGGWKEAAAIEPCDELLARDLGRVPAATPLRLREPIDVFDLSVDGPHTYFAGGFLVHNKSGRPSTPGTQDLWYYLWPAKNVRCLVP